MKWLDRLTRPIQKLFNVLSFRRKFSLIGFLLFLPVIVLSALTVSDSLNKSDALEEKQQVAMYWPEFKGLFEHVAKHRGMTGTAEQRRAFSTEIQRSAQHVDKHLNALADLASRYESLSESRVIAFKRSWQQLKGSTGKFDSHSQLIAQLHQALKQLSTDAKLLLEDDLVSLQLARLSTESLPQLVELSGQLRGLGAQWLNTSGIASQQVMTLSYVLESEVEQFVQAVEALTDNSNDETLMSHAKAAEQQLSMFSRSAAQHLASRTMSADDFFREGSAAIGTLLGFYDAIIPVYQQRLGERLDKLDGVIWKNIVLLALVLLLQLLLFTSLYLGIYRAVTANINMAKQLANGDLNSLGVAEGKDELSKITDYLNSVAIETSYSVDAIRKSSDGMDRLGDGNYQAIKELAERAKEQAAQMQSAAAAVEQMTAAISEVSESTQKAATEADNTMTSAQNGQQVVNTMVEAIQRLEQEVSESQQVIKTLSEDSQAISKILLTINDIADQTNLLALNAAIEAARAGESGRGFAVVADEVRQLAQRVQASTGEIQSVIGRLESNTENAVHTMERNKALAGENVEHANKASMSLTDIVENVGVINDLNTQIASAAEEQSAVTMNIQENVNSLSESAKVIDERSQEALESSAQLTTLGGEIKSLGDRYYIENAVIEKRLQEQDVLIEWSSKLDVGIEEINRQHQRLIYIANELYRLKLRDGDQHALQRLVDSLINYTATHFNYEELLMERNGYPDLENHKVKHKELVQDVMRFKHRVDNHEDVIDELLDFVKAWLMNHIMKSDMAYKSHLNGKGIR
ncbi:bacteriohemerythrin [Idiomarina piscisalsi]|uniref:bacteriohemerythrin n=1 Tax=Idiomarina piscisalsi TaxID=1096243 RepID=UPI00137ED4B2|nr:bacteriohemerythrin [Idiomarina piscisalsi]MTJ01670.1 bacteriohemerythrin [Idiomarina piscisalsi]